MREDQFSRLYSHMMNRFDDVDSKLDEKATQSSVYTLTDTVDGLAMQLDRYEIEQGSRDLYLDWLTTWAREVSKKTGISLKDL